MQKTIIPHRPKVKRPSYWSNAVQDIEHYAVVEASNSLGVHPWDLGSAADRLKEELGNPRSLREFYEVMLHFIAQAKPDYHSKNGLPVDRAQARLKVWLELYGR